MKTFLSYLLGDMDPALFAAAVFIAIIGALMAVWLGSSTRDKDSMRTPTKFSWSFLFDDNKQRIVLNLLLIFAAIRFSEDIIGLKITADNLKAAFFIGLSLDSIAGYLRNKNIIDKK